MRGITLKDSIRELAQFRSRTIVAGLMSVLLILVLVGRLFYLQIYNHNRYTTLSHNNRVNILPIAPTRGLIYDRNGVLLADNIPTFRLEIVPERVPDMDKTLEEIGKLIEISDADLKRFRESLKRSRRFKEVPLRYRLNDTEVARIAVNRHRLPGVEINSRLSRYYPLGELTAHVVGYVGRINERELQQIDASNYAATSHIGKVGIEKTYEEELHGRVGFQQVETNARGRILRELERTPPVPGRSLYLNIDMRLQKVAEEAFGGERGALVAIDPRDGSVLALVSTPSYDPNLFVNGIDSKTYSALRDSPDRPLFNRAIRGRYPPGSTIKPIVGLAGLESGLVRPHDHTFCPGYYKLEGDDWRYRDWKRSGHGPVTLHRSIVESCDVFYYDLAFKLGIDRLSGYLDHFGFGQRTGIDLVGEASGLLPSRQWKREKRNKPWYPGETLITGIGQGFMLTTPLQLATFTGTLSMDGRRFRPRLVGAMEDPATGEPIERSAEPLPAVPVKKRKNWELIRSAMHDVVQSAHGTARRIGYGVDYTIAGKTGTAQVFGIEQGARYVAEEIAKRLRDHALFVSFAPVENPQIAIGVIVENGGSGGAVAAPVAGKVLNAYFENAKQQAPEVTSDDAR
jgi:penicillin-binding protein 2